MLTTAVRCTKSRYPEKRAAQGMRNAIAYGRRRKGRPRLLEVYHCPACRAWHLRTGRRQETG